MFVRLSNHLVLLGVALMTLNLLISWWFGRSPEDVRRHPSSPGLHSSRPVPHTVAWQRLVWRAVWLYQSDSHDNERQTTILSGLRTVLPLAATPLYGSNLILQSCWYPGFSWLLLIFHPVFLQCWLVDDIMHVKFLLEISSKFSFEDPPGFEKLSKKYDASWLFFLTYKSLLSNWRWKYLMKENVGFK